MKVKRSRQLLHCPFRLLALSFLLFMVLASLGLHYALLTTEDITASSSALTSLSIMHRHQESTAAIDNDDENTARQRMLSPMWSCAAQEGQRSNHKLVFVHVFKTAGMTMRELFLRYAISCHAGIGLVSECSGLSKDSITSITPPATTTTIFSNTSTYNPNNQWWVNGFGSKQGKPCLMKAINRIQDSARSFNSVKIESSMLSQLDILAGHLPLGVGAAWDWEEPIAKPSNSSSYSKPKHNILYVTFFRQAATKFVSGIMYQKKDQNYSFDDIVDLIRKRVRGELAKGKYREGYSAYLLTPHQKEQYYGRNFSLGDSTVEDRTRQILRNLEQENVLVGIVERMSESLELLQFVIDQDSEQAPLFESYGMKHNHPGKNGEETVPAKVNNPSKFSTASVVAELQQDPEFYSLLEEYVKYDAQVYTHALGLHKLQY